MDPTVLAQSYWPLQGAGAGGATPHTRGDGSDVLLHPPTLSTNSTAFEAPSSGERHIPSPRTCSPIRDVQGRVLWRLLAPFTWNQPLPSPRALNLCFAHYCVHSIVYFNEEIPWRHESCLIYTQFSDSIHTTFDFSGFFRFLDVNWELHMPLCCAKSLQSRQILCDPMDQSPPGSSVDGILQARILEWVAMPSSRDSSWHRRQTESLTYPALVGRFFTAGTTWEAHARQI